MSFRALAWAEDVTGLQWATKGILLLLASKHNGESGQCNPSESWLCEKTGLSARAIRMHVKAIEDAGLMERLYKHGGRGVGRSVAGYHLKIGITGAVSHIEEQKEHVQDIATAEFCHGKKVSLPRQDIAKPIIRKNRKEPESFVASGDAPLDDLGKSFDRIWSAWSSEGRKRSKAKAKCRDALRAATKRASLADIERGALRFAGEQAAAYHPALDRWLRDGKWEHWLAPQPDHQPAGLPADPGELAEICARYIETDIWPARYGPPPHEPGCVLPQGWLMRIAQRLTERGHRRADLVSHHAREAA